MNQDIDFDALLKAEGVDARALIAEFEAAEKVKPMGTASAGQKRRSQLPKRKAPQQDPDD